MADVQARREKMKNLTLERAVQVAEIEDKRLDIAAAVAADIEGGELITAAEVFITPFPRGWKSEEALLKSFSVTYRLEVGKLRRVVRGLRLLNKRRIS